MSRRRRRGLVGMARSLASEFTGQNIRPNVASPRQHRYQAAQSRMVSGHVPSAAGIPLGRQGHVDEIAATCLFLVSDDGAVITDKTIHVNGGAGYY
jgi:3-oxoacyl-[acyl-carrier protein] reductase